MSRHDLRSRPVFHHTRDAIEAHLTVVMASLAVARYLQDATGISIKRVIRALKPLQDVIINLNGHQITAQPQITQTAAGILKSLHPRALRRHETGATLKGEGKPLGLLGVFRTVLVCVSGCLLQVQEIAFDFVRGAVSQG